MAIDTDKLQELLGRFVADLGATNRPRSSCSLSVSMAMTFPPGVWS